jgi:hypothetical protein
MTYMLDQAIFAALAGRCACRACDGLCHSRSCKLAYERGVRVAAGLLHHLAREPGSPVLPARYSSALATIA